MPTQYIVVDGSNIATEGRSTPSLDQLEGAVAEIRKEFPESEVTVVVDATFAHRIDTSELPRYEQAALRGEMISPPAGAIGRGDAFLLRIAEKVDALVLSNDSFQEFHGEHAWLFDRGRLLGATPVPGVGWIFVPRSPVRGPKSRVAVRDGKRARARVERAIAEATKEAVAPADKGEQTATRPRRPDGHPQAVNDPTTFISFIAEHRLGEQLDAEVESFSSHGAVVLYGDVRCYVPLSGLGAPPPRSAREVLHKGETKSFVVTALDPYRRGVELALPEVAVVSGRPSEETVAAEVRMARAGRRASHPEGQEAGEQAQSPAPARRRRQPAREASPVAAGPPTGGDERPLAPTSEEAPAAAGSATAASPGAPVQSGPRTRRARTPPQAPATAGAGALSPEAGAPVGGAEPPAASPPAPGRPRRAVKKAAVAPDKAAATAQHAGAPPAGEQVAGPSEGPSPRRRRSRATAEQEAAAPPEPTPAPPEPTAPAPRRRRATAGQPEPQEPAEAPPAPATRRRRSAAEAPAPVAPPPARRAVPARGAAPPQAAPRRQRRRVAAAEAPADGEAPAGAPSTEQPSTEQPATERPAPARRTRAKRASSG